MADSKLASFLTSNKLNSDRVLAVSHKIESLRVEDRNLKLAQRRAKGEGDKAGPKPEGKPRSGRPVSPRALSAAMAGTAVSGPAKQRILRAVNYLLAQKKKDAVELKTLF